MARQRHLNSAPITEALIDFRVQTSHRLDAQAAKVFFGSITETTAELYQ